MAQGEEQPQRHPGLYNPRIAQDVAGHLHALCKEGKYKEIDEFIRTYKVDLPILLIDRRGSHGYTPVHEAVLNDHSQVLQLFSIGVWG